MHPRLRLSFLALLFPLLSNLSALSQGNVFDVWHFGQNAGLDFNGSVTPISGGQTVTNEGTASICDTNGTLLFYTDGVNLWDKAHGLMPNGSGLSGDVSTTQAALIVKQPGSTSLFYVFTVPADGGLTDLRYSIVDMGLNGGLGDVVSGAKNVFMATGSTVAEKITAIRHCNDVDWWIVTHELGSNNYKSWLLSAAGLGANPVVSGTGTVITTDMNRGLGWMTANHTGEQIALPSYSGGTLDLVDFDNSDATVSNARVLTGLTKPYGTEFSSSDQFLYTTEDMSLYQYDASLPTDAQIMASRTLLVTEGNMMRAIRMGPDGKIYVCREWSNFLGVIAAPDVAGLACGYNDMGIDLSPGFNSLGLPNHYKFGFKPCEVTGVQDGDPFALRISPNPSYGRIGLEFPLASATLLQIEILNSLGQTVWHTSFQGRAGSNQLDLALSDLPGGTYVVRIHGEDVYMTRRLVRR